jgi:hypothetical protein
MERIESPLNRSIKFYEIAQIPAVDVAAASLASPSNWAEYIRHETGGGVVICLLVRLVQRTAGAQYRTLGLWHDP